VQISELAEAGCPDTVAFIALNYLVLSNGSPPAQA
jgi:hypothetical protein